MFVLIDNKDKVYLSASIKELAKVIGKSPATLRRWIKHPNNKGFKVYKVIPIKSKQGGKRVK